MLLPIQTWVGVKNSVFWGIAMSFAPSPIHHHKFMGGIPTINLMGGAANDIATYPQYLVHSVTQNAAGIEADSGAIHRAIKHPDSATWTIQGTGAVVPRKKKQLGGKCWTYWTLSVV